MSIKRNNRNPDFFNREELFQFLEEKYQQYNHPAFIESDPISIPHNFSKKEDIEIAGFLTAAISWGQRKTIINNARKLIHMMDDSPHDFIINSTEQDLKAIRNFKHRTFNETDCIYFLKSLKDIYKNQGGLEKIFNPGFSGNQNRKNVFFALINFRKIFFSLPHPTRTEKHISNPLKGASAKRLNMFLRWMVRKDKYGVDFGLWKNIKPSHLLCPLDIHSGNVARKLGLLKRNQNDWRAVKELTNSLKKFDKYDPVKYDFALFGLGVFENF